MVVFIFDLDGTVSEVETLPLIATEFGVQADIAQLTLETVSGSVPFMESFIRRVGILGRFPVARVSEVLSHVPLNEELANFIRKNADRCSIATGNFRGWISQLCHRLECTVHASEGVVDEVNGGVKLTKILKKEEVVLEYKNRGYEVVFVGDGNNDAEAMRVADIAIACGIVHAPANSVMQVADYVVYNTQALVRLLNQIMSPGEGLSLVISAAGIGSRLGMSQTKSLIKLDGKTLIARQLESFAHLGDLRVVVGYQSSALISEVLGLRKDVIFAINHDYFHTKTAASLYLGARHANATVICWDGDLLVHPADIEKCLDFREYYLGVSERTSSSGVYTELNDLGEVVAFSEQVRDYEWTGPACLPRYGIRYNVNHVYEMVSHLLPLPAKRVRARDIDTYEDYQKAITFVREWTSGNSKIHKYYERLSDQIKDPTETRNKSPDFSKYDIAFVRKYADLSHKLLDLGAGTGLLVNELVGWFAEIRAVEKYSNFSKFISPEIEVVTQDINDYETSELFDLITLFGVMNFFNECEARRIYKKCHRFLKNNGRIIVKNQMGIDKVVHVDGYSDELGLSYYSEYRSPNEEEALLAGVGFKKERTVDIYPDEFNRWPNTRFKALVFAKVS